jgi:hypothetical protein
MIAPDRLDVHRTINRVDKYGARRSTAHNSNHLSKTILGKILGEVRRSMEVRRSYAIVGQRIADLRRRTETI